MTTKEDENQIVDKVIHSMFKFNTLHEKNKALEKKLIEIYNQTKLLTDNKNSISKDRFLTKKNLSIILGLTLVGFLAGIEINNYDFFNYKESNTYLTGYEILNLRGDVIETIATWILDEDELLVINIINNGNDITKVEAVKNAILSEEVIEIENKKLHTGPISETSKFFRGWKNALNEAANVPTQLDIPKNFKIIESKKNTGDIIIELTNYKSGDGYSGFTRTTIEEDRILKANILIYDVQNLSEDELEVIVRHELGHAFGLAHSSDPNDLMFPQISTETPYISECSISAIIELYDGNHKTKTMCKK